MEQMIGLSLSFCIKDVLNQTVNFERIKKIVTSCRVKSQEDFELLLDRYTQVYWKDLPSVARKLAQELFNAGRLEFPRNEDNNHFPNIAHGVWVKTEEEIRWNDQLESFQEEWDGI
jgi:hypothetical protein